MNTKRRVRRRRRFLLRCALSPRLLVSHAQICRRSAGAPCVRVFALSRRATHADPGSLLAMLTSAVGDLASVTIPITYMEPTSFLQRLAEAFQNSELLDMVRRIVVSHIARRPS